VPGAASTWVAERVAGPRRRAEVVASGPYAVYVSIDGDCLGVLARDAVAVPIGLRTTLDRLPEVRGPVEVGDGAVSFAEYAVAVTRIVDPTVPRIAELSGVYRARTRHAPDNFAGSLGLPAVALRALAEAEASAVLDLLGRGDGLTPSGDDVLAGWLVARYATGREATAVAAAVSAYAGSRTTPMSAALLHRALAGESIPHVRDLLIALGRGIGVDAARDRLLTVGHTSGTAMALGIGLALEAAG
jgi:hypothetical protein